jgi:hypothetical protein
MLKLYEIVSLVRFADHYNGNRTPFLMIVDPAWAANQDKRDGTTEFLQYIRAAFGVIMRS